MPRISLCVFLLPFLLLAQSERGNITGTITDPTGAPVAGASVSIIQRETNATSKATTTDSGEYNILNLPPGAYRVVVSAQGFKQFVRPNVVLATSGTIRADAQLQLGQVSETIEVTAEVSRIQTDDAKVTTQVDNKLVDELPLQVAGDMRSPFNLVAVVPEARGAGQTLSLGGGQVAAWDATLDGHSVGTNRSADTAEAALNTPSLDALTEFTVDTNGFKAEYSQASGGVMTFASKSGTNRFHGTAFDFLRNDWVDARGFFALTRSIYRQNDFGMTVSGPVVIPKVYNGKNRSFYFVSYEGFRNRVGANNTNLTVPTPEMYKGDFQYWVDTNNRLVPVYDPASTRANAAGNGFVRDIFPNNQIPVNRFSKTAAAIMALAQPVEPNRGRVPGNRNYITANYQVPGGTLIRPTDKWSAKADHMVGAAHRFSFLWNATTFRNKPGPGGPPGLPLPLWDGEMQAWDTAAYRVSHDWTVNSRIINRVSFAINSFVKNSFSPNVDQNWKDKACIKNAVDCNQNFPNINFTEFTGWGAVSYNGTEQPGWGLKNDLSYIRSSHTFKFGFQHQNQNADGFGQQDIGGRADFSFLSTSIPGATTFPASGGSSFASFLLGDAFLGRTETIRAVKQKYPYFGFYAQDDWRISKRLTFNYGVRYDVTLPPTSSKDEYSDFNPTRPNPGADGRAGALWFAGFGPGRENARSLVPGWYKGISPRIGFAFAPDSKTAMRAGFGVSYSRVTAVQGSGHFAGFIGQYQFENTTQGIQPTFRLDEGLPAYRLPPAIDPAFSNGNTVDFWNGQDATRAPQNVSWTYSIQREVAKNTIVDVGYNATIGMHLQSGLLNLNQVPSAVLDDLVARFGPTQALNILRSDITSATARNAGITPPYPSFVQQRARTVNQALRPFPQYSTIVTGGQNGDKSGHSSYHAVLVKASRRYARDVTIQWSYLFAKLLTDSDTYFANSATASMDHYNRRIEKSIGQYDRTHTFKFSTIWNMPFGKGQRWLTRGLLSQTIGGWRISAIQVYTSGAPLALARNNPLPIFNGGTRPQVDSYDDWRVPLVGDYFDPRVDIYLKPAAQFPAQPAAGFGNATRYNPQVRGFWNLSENVSLSKTFHLTEQVRADLRGEAFNALNRTVFSNPQTNLNNVNFGRVTGQANSPRQMQVALKIYW
ncbi:MAG: TonB-dependent receptor [Bryobacteraceae bacterium]